MSDRRIEDYLINEEVDAAVMIDPSLTHGYYEQKLYTEELCIYSSELSSNLNHSISLAEINLNEVLLHEDLRDSLVNQLKDLGSQSSEKLKKNNIQYLKGNLETLKNIIDVNGGTMFLPKIAATYVSPKNQNRLFSLTEKKIQLNVSLVSTRGFEKKRILKQLVNDLSNLL